MKLKRILCLCLALVMITSMFVGCAKKNTTTESGDNTVQAGTISVAEIKQKYGEVDDGKIMPLYNLDPNEQLEIPLKYTPTDERAIFSIHTDEKCLPESEVTLMWSPSSYMPSGPKTYSVKPIMAPLSNSTTEGLWGNVSNYYIKFNYDINAETETKLEEPVIVPMSIKSPANIPDTSYEIKDGNFTLKWTKVEGATSYKIYQRQIIRLLETTNIAPKGKEEAYTGAFPMLVKEVDANTLSYSDWMKDGKNGLSKISANEVIGGYLISYQNMGVNGEYYVTAVVNGKESLFSMGISTSSLSLPHQIKSGQSIAFNTYETMDDLPKTIDVTYVDGSTHKHNVSYETKSGSKQVTYYVEGTSIIGYVTVNSVTETVKQEAEKGKDSGFIGTENNIPQNAPNDIPTINTGKGSTNTPEKNDNNTKPTQPEEPSKPDTAPSKPEQSEQPELSDKPADDTDNTNDIKDNEPTIIEQQIENTKEIIEEGNKETITVSDDMVVIASSAAEEYLALNLIAGETQISLAAFPELQNWATLTDILDEVVYQNPMILGVRMYGYNYGTMMLDIQYDYTKEEIATRQKEIKAEGKKVIESIITKDMDDAAKRKAIYDYLEANTVYDDGALESAEANNFQGVDKEFRDAFSTYGILVKKKGVCQSYAMTYSYLAALCDLDCIVVTGNMLGYLPHAWNKVKVGNEWLTTDVTNNKTSTGIEYFMYENPDKVAYAFGYIEDDLYYTQDELGVYVGNTLEYSKYKNVCIESKSALIDYIKKNAKPGTAIEFVATYEDFSSNDITEALQQTSVKEIGSSFVICGYVYFEITK